ncbi:MAG TPA: alanine racemase [Candidatus Paceibacterota bacterium]|nr:alanine racemase [Candidatus Paceibacterota bacterium]
MSARRSSDKNSFARLLGKRTWLELDRTAVRTNFALFRKLIGPRVKLWTVVKSNAYGHGLVPFSKLADRSGVDGFCVDSIIEGLRLRRENIARPMLVLGPTLPDMFSKAAPENIAVSVSTIEGLKAIAALAHPPDFHIKIDTGMHRRGFYPKDLPAVIRQLKRARSEVRKRFVGAFTHFAAAKDLAYPTYTNDQFAAFEKALEMFHRAGWPHLVRHAAATGGVLMNKKYHLDAVRLGIGSYGLWPSRELETELGGTLRFRPVLAWRTVVTELKHLRAGDFVGYDLTERITRPTLAAVLPIGYWHGFPRSLSSIGEVLVRGHRAKVLGRVSMDILVVDVTGSGARLGDEVTLIGSDGRAVLGAADVAARAGTTHYEYLTRLNPLMEKVIV